MRKNPRSLVEMNALVVTFVLFLRISVFSAAQETRPVAWWAFDIPKENVVPEKVSGVEDRLSGNFRYYKGVSGQALKFDGYTTIVKRRVSEVPKLSGAFTVEAWVAVAAFPWNWCPVVSHSEESAGYALEIGPDGEVAMKVFSGSAWRTCISRQNLPHRTWTHIAGVFDPDKGLAVYIDGKQQARLEFQGRMMQVRKADLVIGSVQKSQKPAFIHREHGTLAGWYSLDALLDEIKIYDESFTDHQIAQASAGSRIAKSPNIPPRILPRGPDGPGRFGAYYTHLQYYWEWDDLWRVADHPDVVVQFDESPVRVVFWRGTRYSPAWVTENNLWMADQSVEAWNNEEGCFEHMQDRHCRYSHVRIIENTPARVVVHWRYAPVSAYNNHWNVDPRTGWGCWVDEYYYFYPDQTGIRKYTWEKGSLGRPRQFQESIPLTGPGQVQGDIINEEYVTIANMKGEKQVFTYVKDPPPKTEKDIPENPNIQRHNLKSRNKPFIIFEPGGDMHYLRDMNIDALSRPGSCSHWPVGQMCCDGRTQQSADRATSFLGFPITRPVIHEQDNRNWASSLYGMNDKPLESLIQLARSWIHAPELEVHSGDLINHGYDLSQRAYILESKRPGHPRPADICFLSNPDSPVLNFCLVIKDWGETFPKLAVNHKPLEQGKGYRLGHVRTLDGTDLLVWIETETKKPMTLSLRFK